MSKEKVVLAYSGGLDTTAIIPWLKETFGYDVICCCIDCGQGEELDGLDERAKLSGASKLYIENIVDEFAEDFIMPCVKAGAVYENQYLLGTSMARPAIAKKLVEIARKEGAVAICHGATGKGNDQIRFELGIKALAPDIKIIAPWRMTDLWTMQSREDEIEYCKKHGIDLPFDTKHSYSRDRNLWHISHEGLELEDPSVEPNYDDLLVLSVAPEKAPDEPGPAATPPHPSVKSIATFPPRPACGAAWSNTSSGPFEKSNPSATDNRFNVFFNISASDNRTPSPEVTSRHLLNIICPAPHIEAATLKAWPAYCFRISTNARLWATPASGK